MASGEKPVSEGPEDLKKTIADLEASLAFAREELEVLQKVLKDASARERRLLQTETLLEKRTAELRETAGQYKALFDNSILGIYKTTPEGRYLSVNAAFARIAGFASPEEMISSITDIGGQLYVDPEVRHRLKEILSSRGSVENYPAEIRRKDGKRIWISINAAAVLEKGLIHYEGTIQDVTARRKAEEALRQSELRFRTLMQSDVIGVIVADTSGNITEANDMFLKMIGYSREDLPIRWDALTPPEWRRLDEEMVRELSAVGKAGPTEKEYFRKDGTRVPILAGAALLDAEKGLAVVYVLDLTAKKKLEKERMSLEEDLRQAQKMESVGRLAGGIAHSFNNFLTPIIGYTGFVLESAPRDFGFREELETIRTAAERARELTRQLLAFGRKQVLEVKPVDLSEVIVKFENVLRGAVREDIRIETVVPAALPLVRADAGQMEQVVMHLAANGQDAMSGGGKLTISLEEFVQGPSHQSGVQGMPEGRYVLLCVKDTGTGMDKLTLDRLFEPFFTTKGFGKGSGMGLSMVYGVVRQHGGYIQVFSEIGKGSTFRVFLPASEESASPGSEKTRPRAGRRGAGETILVVEDNAMVRNMTSRMLERMGYRVLTAECGEGCMELINDRDLKIDLLLTDVVMPGMNGRELYERLRSSAEGLKVVYMSGYDSNVIAHHGIIEKGVHFLQKPFTMAALQQKINEAFGV